MKTVWRHGESGEVRISKPEGDGWVEVPIEELKPSERLTVRIMLIEEQRTEDLEKYDRRVNDLVREVDLLSARLAGTGAAMKEGDKPKPVSIFKVVRGILTGSWEDAGYEESVVQHVSAEERASTLTSGSDTLGGYVVPPEYLASEFITLLYNAAPAFQAGARRLPLSGSPGMIPGLGTGATAYWVGESAAITASNQTLIEKSATPHALAALTRVSNRLLRMSNPGIEGIVREDIARTLSVELDRAIYYGDNGLAEPLGLLNTTGINEQTTSGAATLDTLWGQILKIEEDNADVGPMAIISSHKQWGVLRAAADSAGQPKHYEGAGAPIKKEMYGVPLFTSGNLADATVIVGVWSELLVAQWGGLMFEASRAASDGTNHAFTMDQTWIRAIMDVDVVVRRPLSFCSDETYT